MSAPALLHRWSWMNGIAGPWLMLATVDLVLHLAIPGTGLRNPEIPLMTRLSLVALDVLSLFAAGLCVSLATHVIGRVQSATTSRTARSALVAARSLIIGIACLLYAASWAAFWSTGAFLDGEALLFWLGQPVQIFHWVYPPLVVGLLAGILGLVFVLVSLARAEPRLRPTGQRRLLMVSGSVFVGAIGLVTLSSASNGWSALLQPPTPYAVNRLAHAGPIVHALLDAARRLTPAETPRSVASNATDGIERRPIVSMENYLAGAGPRTPRRLNVVMVQVESLRSDQLRAYGGMRDVMPAVDALARESRVFTNAYVQASHSNYADLVPLSSQYPLRSPSMYTFPQNPPYPRVLIYDVLKALGYRTGIFSSQNEGWGGMINFHRASALDRLFHAQTFKGPTYAPWEDLGFADWVRETGSAGSVDDRFTVDEAIKWVDTLGAEPFFLHMNLQSSHLPYVVPAGFARKFGPATLDFAILWGKFPLDRVNVVKDRYADSLNYVDTQLARLFDHLRAKGLWDSTIIVFGGDNGEAFFEHGFAAHATWLFNEVVKVPMLVRVPGLAPGRDDRPAMFLDVPPSIVDLLGLPPHPGFQGISLLAPNPNPDRSMFMIVQTPSAYETAIVRGRYKLHFAEMEQGYFLNDLLSDPGESTDVGPRLPAVVADLTTRLQQWREAQLSYYRDLPRQQREYPPVIVD